ncbi:MAG TPA: DUF4388 domain-containing protein [Planctomycetes bacterium]|nr:DUF4388 domain-containing protein [Planctomycetota bacterium]
MSTDPTLHGPAPVDPGGLSQVLMRLRDLRRHLENSLGGGLEDEQSQFLRTQVEQEVREIEALLQPLKGKKTKGLVARFKEHRAKRGREAPDFQGNSWTISIPDLVGFLSCGRKTGVLWVDSEAENFVIELREGGLVRATSNRTPETLRLGELLVQLGALDKGEIEQVVQDARQAGMSLGGYLIRSGRAKEEEIEAALLVQVQSLFQRLMSTENAVYRFREGVDLADAQSLDLNVTQLLLEGARLHDEGSLWRNCDCPAQDGDDAESEEPTPVDLLESEEAF